MKTIHTLSPRRFAMAILLTGAIAAYSTPGFSADPAPATVKNGVLVGDKGMTLYVFDKDAGGKSMCNGPCADNWPPLLAPAGAKPTGDFGVIARDDGKQQYTYKGKPLYYWAKDKNPGDQTGDGVNNVWHVAK